MLKAKKLRASKPAPKARAAKFRVPAHDGEEKIIAERLLRMRKALGLSQAAFCREICVEKNLYNPFERGRRRITLDVARAIRARFAVSLDWIYEGDMSALRNDLAEKLQRVQRAA